jgi:regulator of protease activity HflC (stomatin/prohibitin superfamily)
MILEALGILFILVFFLSGIRIVRPTHRALIERFGRYKRFANAGFHWIIPIVDRMFKVDITENMMDVRPQEVITKDNLNARVDLMVYYKVKAEENNVKKSRYNVEDFERQIVSLAQTTARNVIGTMMFKIVNSERNKINRELAKVLGKESDAWGVQVVRVEMKEITPPKDVQDVMNKVLKAENEKIAAIDYATAKETEADGIKRAAIKEAEGQAKAIKIVADADAQRIKLVNDAARKYFKGDAQLLKKLEVTENSLKNNSKIIVPENSTLVIGDTSGIVPIKMKKR